jgi:putative membrane protein
VTEPRRWPRWVYGEGEEPDVRFSFANERTFLAWVRTALAVLAAGVALEALPLSVPGPLQRALAAVFVLLGLACAVSAWLRWARAERAMRRDEPLPPSRFGLVLSTVLGLAAAALLVGGLLR